MIEHAGTWWFNFFNNSDYLDLYGDTVDEPRTKKELNFCDLALQWKPGERILDAPCGQGRHTRKLREQGHNVISLDISPYLLDLARKGLGTVHGDFVRGNLAGIPLQTGCVQYAISMFSSFGYCDTHEQNISMLREYARVLAPGGLLLIDVMNRHFLARFLSPVFRHKEQGMAVREERQIVEDGRRLINIITVTANDGLQRQYPYKPWLFNGWELSLMAEQAGLHPVKVYGSFEGAEYDTESERAMLVARKP